VTRVIARYPQTIKHPNRAARQGRTFALQSTL
jgi:hypothetical protein